MRLHRDDAEVLLAGHDDRNGSCVQVPELSVVDMPEKADVLLCPLLQPGGRASFANNPQRDAELPGGIDSEVDALRLHEPADGEVELVALVAYEPGRINRWVQYHRLPPVKAANAVGHALADRDHSVRLPRGPPVPGLQPQPQG